MKDVKVTIHGTGVGPCSLSGKEGDGLTVTFEDGTVREAFLSWKAFQQLLRMKTGQAKVEKPVPTAVPVNSQPK